jgi:O-Antigen ligase
MSKNKKIPQNTRTNATTPKTDVLTWDQRVLLDNGGIVSVVNNAIQNAILPFMGIVACLITALVPIFVRSMRVHIDGRPTSVVQYDINQVDPMTYGKSILFVVLSSMFLLCSVLVAKKAWSVYRDSEMTVYILKVIGAICVGLLTLVWIAYYRAPADLKDIAWWGYMTQYQGVLTYSFYTLNFLGMALFVSLWDRSIYWIVPAIMIPAIVIGSFAIPETFKLNMLSEWPFKFFTLAQWSDQAGAKFQVAGEGAGSTLTNPNYLGTWAPMTGALFLNFLIDLKSKWRFPSLVTFILSMCAVWSAASLTGFALFIFSAVLILLFRYKAVIQNWRNMLTYIVIAIIITLPFLGKFSVAGDRAQQEAVVATVHTDKFSYDIQVTNSPVTGDGIAVLSFKPIKISMFNKIGHFLFHKPLPATDFNVPDSIYFHAHDNILVPTDKNGNTIPMFQNPKGPGSTVFADPRLQNFSLSSPSPSNDGSIYQLNGTMFKVSQNQIYVLNFNGFAKGTQYAKKIPSWIPDTFATARGYIWTRSIPLLRLLGYGGDVYLYMEPQADPAGKMQSLGVSSILVDKPHDLYIQEGVANGILYIVLVFIVLLGALWWFGFTVLQKSHSAQEADSAEPPTAYEIATAISWGVFAFLMTSVFNDGITANVSYFWVLLGIVFGLILRSSVSRNVQ